MPVTINGSAGVTTNTGAVYDSIQRATAQASTSGTNIDFTSIPSWVKRITVMFRSVSTSGTSNVQIQLGTSGGIVSSGYTSSANNVSNTPSLSTSTSAFLITQTLAAADGPNGFVTICNVTGNIWAESGTIARTGTNVQISGGSVDLSGTLDRLRITTVNGTDTFDAGTINILYE
jgi:hypothetical protein